MLRLLYFIDLVLNLYVFILIAAALLSWLVAFNVVNTRNPVVAMLGEFLYRITEPVLRPIRNMLPSFGGIDISPIVAILAIYFIQIVIIGNLREAF
jgi:YggT family protein